MRCDTYPVCGSGRLSTNLQNLNRRMAGLTHSALSDCVVYPHAQNAPHSRKGCLMNRDQYAEMLKDISETSKAGGDVSVCVKKYRKIYNYVYIYNDNIFMLRQAQQPLIGH
jgi:hypothetical protein